MSDPAPATVLAQGFRPGIDALLGVHRDWIAGRRIGLVSHMAAVDLAGVTTAERLLRSGDVVLSALFGPEHGFGGRAAAGESAPDYMHADWRIPVFSLYGERRRPTPEMLAPLDALVFDIQDLGARPYTYVSTLRLVIEAATEARKPLFVADRPVPLPRASDGPGLDPACASFVGLVPAPMQYGLTPGETALWLRSTLALDADIRVAPLTNYARDVLPSPDWPAWVPPSPRIHSWEAACLFTATVAGEALPALDYGSGTGLSFQVLGAPWMHRGETIPALEALALPGVHFEACDYRAASGIHEGILLQGIRIRVTDAATFSPVRTSVGLLAALQALYGKERLWNAPGTRPGFFDKLFGTATVREALQAGESGAKIAARWQPDLRRFEATRSKIMLYRAGDQ